MLLKIAEEVNIKNRKEYYDHVPGSTTAGSMVGATHGLAAGSLAGATAGRLALLAKNFGLVNKKVLQNGVDASGVKGVNVEKVLKAVPNRKKLLGIGAGLGTALGVADGAYRGAMTGVGMNDRQYLTGEDIGTNDLVYNSRMGALDMNSTRSRFSNAYNDNFGRSIGGLRRMNMQNNKDNKILGDM